MERTMNNPNIQTGYGHSAAILGRAAVQGASQATAVPPGPLRGVIGDLENLIQRLEKLCVGSGNLADAIAGAVPQSASNKTQDPIAVDSLVSTLCRQISRAHGLVGHISENVQRASAAF